MASYRDLLDAIARVGAATGSSDAWKDGLTGADVAVACNPMSPPRALDAVLAALTAAHPAVFAPSGVATTPLPAAAQGATADAIRAAESLLARQRSEAAHLDLQVLTAVANAHATASSGLVQLSALQRDIETVVASRTDLDTPAGARELQRFLIGKMRDIRNVVEHGGLDAESQANLADALGALYASSTPDVLERPSMTGPEKLSGTTSLGRAGDPPARDPVLPDSAVLDDGAAPLPDYLVSDLPADPSALPAAQVTPAAAPVAPPCAAMPAGAPFGGAIPAGAPFGGAMPTGAPFGGAGPLGGGLSAMPSGGVPNLAGSPWPDLSPDGLGTDRFARDADGADEPSRITDAPDRTDPAEESGLDAAADDASSAEAHTEPTPVLLPDGQTVMAPSPELASVITAAVAGAPIPTAFSWQGITIPPPGSPVVAPIDPSRLVPGDIAVLADRHALALGNGKVLLNQQIQPLSSVTGPGFVGWQHPPEPDPRNTPPVLPAPDRSAATAPS